MPRKILAIAGVMSLTIGAILWFALRRDDPALTSALDNILNDYRRVIVEYPLAFYADDAVITLG